MRTPALFAVQQRLADAIEKLAEAETYTAALGAKIRWCAAHSDE